MITKSDYRIVSPVENYGLLLRNKIRGDSDLGHSMRSVLFIHGATYGSTSTFDYQIEGESWMDKMAGQGFDVWCLDLLGYGQSDRPREMLVAPSLNDPIVDTAHAIREMDIAVDFILRHRSISHLSLIGYSWGSAICGRYAGTFKEKVERLVLTGALWVEKAEVPNSGNAELGSYRTVDAVTMEKRWAMGLSKNEIEAIVPPAVVSRWCSEAVLSDPLGEKSGLLRAPTGVIQDFIHHSVSGEPWYQPSEILAPTQIVVGELDAETTPDQGKKIFEQLDNATEKSVTVVGGGTHSLLLENQRHVLQRAVSGFLA